ncbi:hypothetical protein D9613_009268 [Agrocybe pediades]|uniref:Uncharacterized protein n=1 Tax=Agrocybe pediades TaxID=84607 RepID=A0A8H4R315_9AGAR|nr:hypothetical protein D9613_009268 [Agrocybe pediades]
MYLSLPEASSSAVSLSLSIDPLEEFWDHIFTAECDDKTCLSRHSKSLFRFAGSNEEDHRKDDLHIHYDGSKKTFTRIAPFLRKYSHQIRHLTCHFEGKSLDATMLSLHDERKGETEEESCQLYTPYSTILDMLSLLQWPVLEEFKIMDSEAGQLALHVARDLNCQTDRDCPGSCTDSLIFSPTLWKRNRWAPTGLTVFQVLYPSFFGWTDPKALAKGLRNFLERTQSTSTLRQLGISCIFHPEDIPKDDGHISAPGHPMLLRLLTLLELSVFYVQDPSPILRTIRAPRLEGLVLEDSLFYSQANHILHDYEIDRCKQLRQDKELPGLLDYMDSFMGRSLKRLSLYSVASCDLSQTYDFVALNLNHLEELDLRGQNDDDANPVNPFAICLFTKFAEKCVEQPLPLLPKLKKLTMGDYSLSVQLDCRIFMDTHQPPLEILVDKEMAGMISSDRVTTRVGCEGLVCICDERQVTDVIKKKKKELPYITITK